MKKGFLAVACIFIVMKLFEHTYLLGRGCQFRDASIRVSAHAKARSTGWVLPGGRFRAKC